MKSKKIGLKLATVSVLLGGGLVGAAMLQPSLVKDLNSTEQTVLATAAFGASEIASGDYLYMERDISNGDGLWRWSAQTGPQLLKSFAGLGSVQNTIARIGVPVAGGSSSSGGPVFPGGGPSPGNYDNLSDSPYSVGQPGATALSYGGKYYFPGIEGRTALSYSANPDYDNGIELWASDGTQQGTQPFKDLFEGAGDGAPTGFVQLNGLMYFFARAPSTFGEGVYGLWQSNGTVAGTSLVKLVAGTNQSVTNVTVANNHIYFAVGANPFSPFITTGTPWVSDGTASGTYAMSLADGSPILISSNGVYQASSGNYYFCGGPDGNNLSLYLSDGSANGVRKVTDTYCRGVIGSSDTAVYHAGNLNNTGTLFKTTSGAGGTNTSVMVSSVTPALSPVLFNGSWYVYLTDANSNEAQSGLWRIDRSNDSASLAFAYKKQTVNNTFKVSNDLLTVRNNALYFVNSDCSGSSTCGLYRLSDSNANASLVDTDASQFINYAGLSSFSPPFPRPLQADYGSHPVRNELTNPTSTAFYEVAGTRVAFLAKNEGSYSQSLFFTDGSGPRTKIAEADSRLADAVAVQNGLLVSRTVGSNNEPKLYFYTSSGNGSEVASLVGNYSGSSSAANQLTAVGDKVFFIANAEQPNFYGDDRELWVWQPDQAAHLVKDTLPGIASGLDYGSSLLANGNRLYFLARNSNQGQDLWTSDGSESGTQVVAPISDYTPSPAIFLGNIGSSVLVLNTEDGTNNKYRRLVLSDGTAAGTVQLLNQPGFADPYGGHRYDPSEYPAQSVLKPGISLGNQLLFQFGDPSNGYELWTSDGTVAGTHLLKNLYPGARGGYPSQFTLAGSTVYFVADSGAGRELWKTDGTAAGTLQVIDLQAGPQGSGPNNLSWQADLNRLVFTATTNATGQELWQTDGTAAGTELLADINPGPASSNPSGISRAGPRLVFSADNGVVGQEPTAVAVQELPPAIPLVSVDDISFAENADTASKQFVFKLDAPATQSISVDWTLADGSATVADNDYTAASGTVTFAPGITEVAVPVAVMDDDADEPDETFSIQLSPPANAELLSPQATATITNDDSAVRFMWLQTSNGGYAFINIDVGSIKNARFDAPPAGAPSDYIYPYGFLYLDIAALNHGQQVRVQVQLPPQNQSVDSLIKCLPAGCAPYPVGQVYSDQYGTSGVFQLTDGGQGDADGMANGRIADPIAAAALAQIDPFGFVGRSNVPLHSFITTEPVKLTGPLGVCQDISVNNAQYRINSNAFTNTSGRVCVGDQLTLRQLSASSTNTETLSQVTVGVFSTTLRTVTTAADREPDAFSFVSQTGVTGNNVITSAAITLVGFNATATITPGPEASYSINGGAFTNAKGKLEPGQSLRIRHTASNSKNSYTRSYLNVGGTVGYFITRTK